MWAIWMMVGLASVTGYYAVANQVRNEPPVTAKSSTLAGNMAVYREAVLKYLRDNPSFSGTTISNNLLTLPAWGYTPDPIWTNYIAPDNTVFIYASILPPVDIISELTNLSRSSMLAGRANMTTEKLESIVNTTVNISLPVVLPPAAPIPDKSPIWLAYRG
jgi:hypothetical protein